MQPQPRADRFWDAHVGSQLLVPLFASIAVSSEVKPVVELDWNWVNAMLYGAALVAAGFPVFGVFTWGGWRLYGPSPEEPPWRQRLRAPFARMLVAHLVVIWLLGGAAVASVLAFRAERISFDAMVSVWALLVFTGVACAVGLRLWLWRMKKRALRRAMERAGSRRVS